MAGFDWHSLMRAGLRAKAAGGLGLLPDQFWRLTPAELSVMLGRDRAQAPMGRAQLDDLLKAYPDKEKGE